MIENYNKHYERIDSDGYVIKGFSDAFENHFNGDICVNEQGCRHYNPELWSEIGIPKFRYINGIKAELTQEEIEAYKSSLPKPPKNELEILRETVDALVMSTLGGI